MRRIFTGVWLVLVLGFGVLGMGSRAVWAQGDRAELIGSTVPGTAVHVSGDLDTAVAGVMAFRAEGKPELRMPYDGVFEFGLTTEETFHLGFFPAMFYGMFAPRPQRRVFTVSWHDAAGVAQEATFEVSKSLAEHVIPVMYARARAACQRIKQTECLPVVPPARVPLAAARFDSAGPAAAASVAGASGNQAPAVASGPAKP